MQSSDAAPTMRWQVHLAAREPGKASVVVACALGAGAAGLLLMGHPVFALVGVAVVLGTTLEFLLPLRYELNDDEARVTCGVSVTAVRWEAVKRIEVDADRAKLSPLAEDTRLSPFRGVTLRFDGDPEEVLAEVRRRAPSDARFVDRRVDRGRGAEPDREGVCGDQAPEDGSAGGDVP